EENGVLFSGDTVFTYGDFGRYDFPGGDFNQLVKSIKRLANLNVRNLYPGHGEHILKDGKNHILMALQNLKMI
ncbi:MAG: MBL fold metallo-hydrolase, partial [Thermoplasmata archaeon]|nr:MBL fold metallo-hydrolase [Thermoplasmata archaeon]